MKKQVFFQKNTKAESDCDAVAFSGFAKQDLPQRI